MAFQVGDIACVKLTGELVTVLSINQNSTVNVRRPVVSHEDGISHNYETFELFELESEEAHLRREADSVLLKMSIQREMQKKLDAIEEAEREENAKSTSVDPALLVN